MCLDDTAHARVNLNTPLKGGFVITTSLPTTTTV